MDECLCAGVLTLDLRKFTIKFNVLSKTAVQQTRLACETGHFRVGGFQLLYVYHSPICATGRNVGAHLFRFLGRYTLTGINIRAVETQPGTRDEHAMGCKAKREESLLLSSRTTCTGGAGSSLIAWLNRTGLRSKLTS
jgi:hypothetical protein